MLPFFLLYLGCYSRCNQCVPLVQGTSGLFCVRSTPWLWGLYAPLWFILLPGDVPCIRLPLFYRSMHYCCIFCDILPLCLHMYKKWSAKGSKKAKPDCTVLAPLDKVKILPSFNSDSQTMAERQKANLVFNKQRDGWISKQWILEGKV